MLRKRQKKHRRPHGANRPQHHHLGAPPGALFDAPEAEAPRLFVMGYKEDYYIEQELASIEEVPELQEDWPVVWLDVEGPGSAPLMRRVGELFGFHRLALEDVLHGHQTPKIEEYEDFLFVAASEVRQIQPLQTEALCMFVKQGLVLTFHSGPSQSIETLRGHVRVPRGRVRVMGADFLAYALLDMVIDYYYPAMDHFSDTIEMIEDAVIEQADRNAAAAIHNLKQDLLAIRRLIAPLRDAINVLVRDGHPVLTEGTRIFMRDCHDHMVHVLEFVESYREILGGLLDIYLSSMSARMNDVMRVLTVISTIFIPLTFLVGLYGMNFDTSASPWNMPELEMPLGYPLLLLLLITIAAGELVYFWRKGWIGRRRSLGTKDSLPAKRDNG